MMRFLILFPLLFLVFSCTKQKHQTLTVEKIEIASPSSKNASQPYLFASDDTLWMSWTEKVNDTVASLQYAQLNDTAWSEAKEIAKGSDWFVNWADFPAIAENNGHLLSHFLQKSADGTYTYDIKIKLNDVSTGIWKEDFTLHSDSTQSEHGFVTMLPYKDDSFFVTWLDGRNTTPSDGHHGGGAMTLRTANVLLDGSIANEVELDSKTCDCCQTSAAITQNGPVVVYRDRSNSEVRDISITRQVNGQWTQPQTVFKDNWKIEGCPVNGPKTVASENNLAVAWYTAAEERPKVKLIFSNNNGATFDQPITIDEVKTIGRVDVAFTDETNVLVTWVTSEDNQTVIKGMKVGVNGQKNDPFIVAMFDPSRSSGFPQVEILKDKAYFAWTDVSGEAPMIKTMYVPLDNL